MADSGYDMVKIAHDFAVESWTLFSFGVLVVLFRLFARWRTVGFSNFKLDDYLMMLAICFDATLNGLAHVMLQLGGTNSKLTDEERAALSAQQVINLEKGSKIWMCGWCFYTATVWTLKFCMINFFSRVVASLDRQWMIKWAFLSTGLSAICVYMTFFLTCRPFHKVWQVIPDPGKTCWAETNVYYLNTLAFNLATDIFIISIPVPIMWKAKITPQRKALIMILFGGGVFVCVAAILRCVLGLTSPLATVTAQWACRETFVSIVVGNAPMIKPLFSKVHWVGPNSSSGGSKGQTGGSSSLMELGSRKITRRRDKIKEPHADTLATFNFEGGSTEQIVQHHEPLKIQAERTYDVSSTHAADLERGFGEAGSPKLAPHNPKAYQTTTVVETFRRSTSDSSER